MGKTRRKHERWDTLTKLLSENIMGRFQDLTKAIMKMTVFWYAAPWSLAETDRRFRDAPDDGGSKHLWNVSQFLRGYTAQYPRRLSLSSREVTT
jgi:hypothetical protein